MSGRGIDWPMVLGPLYGELSLSSQEMCDLEQACLAYARRAIRVRPGSEEYELPFATEPVSWYPQGRFLVDAQVRPGAFLHHAAGDYYIQDASSMLALALCDAKPGQWICDLCAAPGGKSTGLLELLNGQGLLVSNEVIKSRVNTLELALARCKAANYLVCSLETEQLVELCGAQFDCVLIDAPCTGQSMVAKGKQSMSAFSLRQIAHSAARQQRILRSAASLVRPGGKLVYSTCTFAYEENEKNVLWLSEYVDDWKPIVDPRLSLWASSIPGTYRLWPHRHGCAGGFAAAFQRHGPTEYNERISSNSLAGPPRQRGPSRWSVASFPRIAAEWEATSDGQCYRRNDGSIHWFDGSVPRHWIAQATAGVCVAESHHDLLLPAYPASVKADRFFTGASRLELADSAACRFMAGESLRNDSQAAGWTIAHWRSRPLAWAKMAAGAMKNHVPKSLRQPGLKVSP